MAGFVRAGFVLAGGKSSRMGRDKALLEVGGVPLVLRAAECVRDAAGNVAIVGRNDKYGHLGLRVIEDIYDGVGPLGGIHAALLGSVANWNLIVACDMPNLDSARLSALFDAASEGRDVVLPESREGFAEPLCAIYHRRALSAIEAALIGGVRKVTDALFGLRVERVAFGDAGLFANINSPVEWDAFQRR